MAMRAWKFSMYLCPELSSSECTNGVTPGVGDATLGAGLGEVEELCIWS
jgi:hypothetical protein